MDRRRQAQRVLFATQKNTIHPVAVEPIEPAYAAAEVEQPFRDAATREPTVRGKCHRQRFLAHESVQPDRVNTDLYSAQAHETTQDPTAKAKLIKASISRIL